ncbi:MAG: hypothetical protein EXQ96_09560 [Alphaproteobacteria bacterium]|nr:hypothetical protein [Alphaproteobacteria bacterium]
MRSLLPRGVLVLALLVLAACATQGPTVYPEISFADKGPITVAVARIEIEDAYVSPQVSPNVEHLFPVVPAAAMRKWAKDRLRAGGGEGSARFVIVDAKVAETKLKRDEGLRGAVTIQSSERYDGRIEGRLEIYDATGARVGFADTVAVRTRTVAENASLAERDQAFYEMTRNMMIDFDASLEKTLRDNLGRHLR